MFVANAHSFVSATALCSFPSSNNYKIITSKCDGIYSSDMLENRNESTNQHVCSLTSTSFHSTGNSFVMTSLRVVLLLSLPCQSWQHFFLSCLVMAHYYQGPSASNIWERRLKHQQFSRWVSSLAWRDERSRCSPPSDSLVVALCRHRAAVSWAARPVMWMRWQESRQVPSKPPGAGQQCFSVWTSLLAQCVLLLICTSFPGNKRLILV